MASPPIPPLPKNGPSRALRVKVENDRLVFLHEPSNTGLAVTFQRTLRIPDDGKSYPLPPGMGAFPLRRVLDYKDRVPASWGKTSGVFLPMYQREAMWIALAGRHWRPNAVKIAAGKINAVSGKPWDQKLKKPSRGLLGFGEAEVDYMVCPPQPWIDGFKTEDDVIRQFIAMPLGMGYTVEGQVTGKEEHGGVQIIVYEPKAGRFPETPPPPPAMAAPRNDLLGGVPMFSPPPPMMAPPAPAPAAAGAAMGLGTGGKITQKIYPDPHGIEAWDEEHYGRVFVHIVAEGQVVLKEMEEHFDALFVANAMGYAKLVDVTKARPVYSDDDVMMMGARLSAYAAKLPSGPLAVVGMANMRGVFKLFVHISPSDRPAKYFASEVKARAWLATLATG